MTKFKVSHGAKEQYDSRDYLGKQLDWSQIKKPKEAVIEYNQDEFKDGSVYCTLYACFAAWSSYTGKELPKEWRKEFIDITIDEGIIEPGVGAYVHETTHRFKKYITNKTGVEYNYARVSIGNQDIHDRGFQLVTGGRFGKDWAIDKNKDGVINDPNWEDDDWGHAISEFDFKQVQNSYKGEGKYNIFEVEEYREYINNPNHFSNGYFFYTLKDENMTQREKDIRDITYGYNEGIYNEEKVKKVKRGVYDETTQCALMIARSHRDLNSKINNG